VARRKAEYFRFLGWDENGIPLDETLEELDLGFLRQAVARLREQAGSSSA
jgi:Aldehyde ferredoxin oxidoreductase, domains 2 & 3.